MAKTEKNTALTVKTAVDLMPDVAQALGVSLLTDEGFAEEKTFGIGDPTSKGSKKVPFYYGELVGPGGTVDVETPGTGEIRPLPIFLFHPLDPTTHEPITQRIDNIIASHQVAQACKKYGDLATAQGGRARLFIRWNGKVETRKGNMMNDIDVAFKVAKDRTGVIEVK